MEILWAILFWLFGIVFAISTGGAGLVAMLLGFLVGAIALGKGRGFWGWSLWGMLLFIVALPHVLLNSKLKQGDLRVDGTVGGVAFQQNKDKSVTARIDGASLNFPSHDALVAFVHERASQTPNQLTGN